MMSKPTLIIYETQTFSVGVDTFVESAAENNRAVAFEDDGETGYFYAIDTSNNGSKILDGLHIYNVANVTDKHTPCLIKILWTEDFEKAFLSINNYYHAMFDFRNHAGYCRNAFPETGSPWVKVKERKLTDALIEEIQN